jgi:hypothetical protein
MIHLDRNDHRDYSVVIVYVGLMLDESWLRDSRTECHVLRLLFGIAITVVVVTTIILVSHLSGCPLDAHPIQTTSESDRITIDNRTNVPLSVEVQSVYQGSAGNYSFYTPEKLLVSPQRPHVFLRAGSDWAREHGLGPAGYSVRAWTVNGKAVFMHQPHSTDRSPCSLQANSGLIVADAIGSIFALGLLTKILRSKGTLPIGSSGPVRPQIVGTVRKIQWSEEERTHRFSNQPPDQVKVCTFRVEGTDSDGNPQHLVTIEIRSESGYSGTLAEGDQIAVYEAKRNGSGSIETAAVRNLTTSGIYGEKEQISRGSVDVPPAKNAI